MRETIKNSVANNDAFAGAVIVVESGSDITAQEAERLGIFVVPMHVELHDADCLDGSFSPVEVFDEYRRTGVPPKTSATTPGEYRELFKQLRAQFPHKFILHLCYSAITTATYDNSIMGSNGIPGIIHIDTKAVASTQATVAFFMARYIAEHPQACKQELVEASQQASARARLCFLPRDLAFLKAGGRLSNAAYVGASLLKMHPLIEVLDGKLVCTQKKRGSFARVCKDTLKAKLAEERFEEGSLFLLDSRGLEEELKCELEEIVHAAGYDQVTWCNTGGVISCHCGLATFGFGGLVARK